MANRGIKVHVYGDYNDKDIKKAIKDLQGLQTDGGKTQTTLAGFGKSLVGVGAAIGVGFAAFQTLSSAISGSIDEANEAIKVNAATAQIIKATGGAAKVTADQVADLSQRISEQIAVDDELIQSSANLILTFKNVANQGEGLAAIFDRTVMAAQDLSAAGFGDAESAAKMLGKALNDPERGLTALSRAGVTFTSQQREQIKTLAESGDMLAAQQVILGEVESQVGGVAAATATGTAQFQVYFDNLKEELGLAIMPLLNALIAGLIPAIKALTDGIKNASSFIQDNKNAIILVTVAVGALTLALYAQRAALTASSIAFAANVAISKVLVGAINLTATSVAALSTAMKLIPFVAVATAAAAFVMVLNDGAAAQKAFREANRGTREEIDKLRDSTGELTDKGRNLVAMNRFTKLSQDKVTTSISGTVGAAVDAGNTLKNVLTPNTYAAGDAADSAAKSYLSMWEAIINAENAERWADQQKSLSGSVMSAIQDGARLGGSPVWQNLAAGYGVVEDAARDAAGGVNAAADAQKKAAQEAKEAVAKYKESFKGVREYLTEAVDDIKLKMADMATSVSASLMRGFQLGDTAEEFGEDGARIGGTFIEKLQAQAEKVTGFAAKIKELMALGLDVNSPLMQAVIEQGAGSGTAIAQHLIDGGAETINQASGMLLAAQGAADEIGTLAAENFYGAGLAGAQETVQAFVDRFGVNGKARERLMGLMDNLANAMKRETTITVTTINRVVTDKVDGKRAMGGPVAAGKAYLVGERGPEVVVMGQQAGYVVPNHALAMTGGANAGGGMTAAGGTNINLTVNAGLGTSGAEVGRQIVDALKAYERRNGSVYVAA